MKQQVQEVLRWTVFSLIFIGIFLLLFGALTISGPTDLHNRLMIAAVVSFGLSALIIVTSSILSILKRYPLTDNEKDALSYLYNTYQEYVSAEFFVMRFGQDTYETLLRKEYLEYYFLGGRQEVYCRLSEKAENYLKKKAHEEKD